MKCCLLGHLRVSLSEEAKMSRVPHLLLVRNKCYYVLETVPSVSIYYHTYIICSVHLLDNPFLMVKTYSSAWSLSK